MEQRFHRQITPLAPLRTRDVSQSRRDQHQRSGRRGNAPTTRVHQQISRMIRWSGFIGKNLSPVIAWKRKVGQRLMLLRFDQLLGLCQEHRFKFGDDFANLVSLNVGPPGRGWL